MTRVEVVQCIAWPRSPIGWLVCGSCVDGGEVRIAIDKIID